MRETDTPVRTGQTVRGSSYIKMNNITLVYREWGSLPGLRLAAILNSRSAVNQPSPQAGQLGWVVFLDKRD